MSEQEYSIGKTTIQSHDEQRMQEVMWTFNYVNADHRLVLPYPKGDWYLRNTGVPSVQEGETVICNTLIPGLREYYRTVGLIPEDAHIMEVEPQVDYLHSRDQIENMRLGFPFTDPLETLKDQVVIQNGRSPIYFASTFSNEHTSAQASGLKLYTVERPDSFITNNKSEFRKAAQEYGYNILPGSTFNQEEQLESMLEELGELPFGAWLKFPTGSGGDLVYRLESLSKNEKGKAIQEIKQGIQAIRSSVLTAFNKAEFGKVTGEGFWPENKLTPDGIELVIESDARNLGEVLLNGSSQFITYKSGRRTFMGHFQQFTTPEGEYLGNRPYTPNTEIDNLITEQLDNVANYNTGKNGYFGWQGTDWFLIKHPDGSLAVYVDELNSRPTANTPPIIIAQKKLAPEWINTNAYTNTPVRTIHDYINIIGEDLAFGEVNGSGLVIPQAFRTLVTRRQTIPSRNFKILIMGENAQHCDQISQTLEERGVRFQPPQAA